MKIKHRALLEHGCPRFPPRRVTRLWLVLLLPLLAIRTFAAPVDATVTINPQAVLVERFAGWGTSLCWWANVLGNATNREAYADLAFKKLQLNIIRYNIGGGENPALHNTMEKRSQMPGFEPQPGVWDWSADANQRWFLRAAVARGVNRVEAFANSPPYWMTVSGSVTGSANGSDNNLRRECEGQFADYLATVVSNLTVLDGVTFNTLIPMNEPGANWWRSGGHQEGTHMSTDQQARMIQLLRPALTRNGLKTGLVGSEDNDESSAIQAIKAYGPAAQAELAYLATHSYHANNPAGIRDLAATLGKPLWITEYGDGEASGLKLARRIRDDIVQTRAAAWIYWQFAEPDNGWGLVSCDLGKPNPAYSLTKKFHMLAQFSCFIRPGFQILDAGDKNSLAAYDPVQRRLVIVAVNDSAYLLTTAYNLSAFRVADVPVNRCRTSATENMADVAPASVSQGQMISPLPPRSVTTHVIDGIVPKSP